MEKTISGRISSAAEIITTKEQLDLPLEHMKSGKVREMYLCGEDKILIVTTDRISSFDRILVSEDGIPIGVPLKGRVLNCMSNLTFSLTSDIIPNHVITTDMNNAFEGSTKFLNQLNGRSVLVDKAEPIMFECVVRGYSIRQCLKRIQRKRWNMRHNAAVGSCQGLQARRTYIHSCNKEPVRTR